MIRSDSRRHPRAALPLGRLTTGQDHARRRSTLDNRIVDQSQPRDAGSANRDRTAALANPSAASQSADQRTSATNRQRRNPHNV